MKRLAVVALVLLCASCMTQGLWEATNPRQFVAMSRNDSTRAYIDEHGLRFYDDAEHDLFLVEKNDLQKFTDYTIRTLGTPITVTLDAAATAAVIVAIAYASAYDFRTDTGVPPADDAERDRIEATLEKIRKEEGSTKAALPGTP